MESYVRNWRKINAAAFTAVLFTPFTPWELFADFSIGFLDIFSLPVIGLGAFFVGGGSVIGIFVFLGGVCLYASIVYIIWNFVASFLTDYPVSPWLYRLVKISWIGIVLLIITNFLSQEGFLWGWWLFVGVMISCFLLEAFEKAAPENQPDPT